MQVAMQVGIGSPNSLTTSLPPALDIIRHNLFSCYGYRNQPCRRQTDLILKAVTREITLCSSVFDQVEFAMKLQSLLSRRSVLTTGEIRSLLDQCHSRNLRAREALMTVLAPAADWV
jgi:hypothetical protein